MPYLNLYYSHLGYNESQIGTLAALRPLVGAAMCSAWSALADQYKCHQCDPP